MRALIVIAIVVLLLALVGWISFSRGPDRTSINLETDEIKKDTQQAMDAGSELLRDAEQAIDPAEGPQTAPLDEPRTNEPIDATTTPDEPYDSTREAPTTPLAP